VTPGVITLLEPTTLNLEVSTDADADMKAFWEVIGRTQFGETVTERVFNPATGLGYTLADGAISTRYAYEEIHQIRVKTDTAADVDAGDRVRVGIGPRKGTPVKIAAVTDVKKFFEGELEGGSGAVVDGMTRLTPVAYDGSTPGAGEVGIDIHPYNTWEPVGAKTPDGTLDYVMEYQSTYGL
jgi:hypothetical protein